jgi:hypothetical protein
MANVKQVFFYTDSALASGDFVKDGALAADLTSANSANIVKNGRTSQEFLKGELVESRIISFNAGTAQASSVDLGAIAGNDYRVTIIDTTSGHTSLPRKSFESVNAASAGAAAINIVAQINALTTNEVSEFFGYSAEVANTDQVVVTAPIDSTFRLASNEGAVIAYTTPMSPSVGTAAKMKQLWENSLPFIGVTNRIKHVVVAPDYPGVVGTNYDVVVCRFQKISGVKDGSQVRRYDDHTVYLAVADGASTLTPADLKAEIDKLA